MNVQSPDSTARLTHTSAGLSQGSLSSVGPATTTTTTSSSLDAARLVSLVIAQLTPEIARAVQSATA